MAKDKPTDLLDWLGLSNAPNWRVSRPLGGVVGFLVVLLVLLALIATFSLLGRTILHGFSEAPAANLGTGAMIVAILSAPIVIWGTIIKQKTVDFQKEGHITDRISKAVEQLGEEKTIKRDGVEETVPNIEVRIAGLLSLERIAQDSTRYDKGRDHVRVMEILCAYIRENAPASTAKDFPLPDWEPLPDDATDTQKNDHEEYRKARFANHYQSYAKQWAQNLSQPREDVALAVRIIGRRDADQRRIEARWGPEAHAQAEWVFDTPCPELPERADGTPYGQAVLDDFEARLNAWRTRLNYYPGYRPDLRGCNLQRHDLSKLVLSGARLDGTRLEGANLSWARLEGADLSWARLEGANLSVARLEGANLSVARLEGANLSWARLEWADLFGARLEWAELRRARLEGANLSWAQLEGADLSWARLEGANLSAARLEGANLSAARLEGANLSAARLEWANLSWARLDGIRSLNAATLQGAAFRDLTLANNPIWPEQVTSTFGDASVTDLPDGMDRPAHWPGWDLGDRFEEEWRKWQADPDNYKPPPKPAP